MEQQLLTGILKISALDYDIFLMKEIIRITYSYREKEAKELFSCCHFFIMISLLGLWWVF